MKPLRLINQLAGGTSQVTNMFQMFYSASLFNQDVSSWTGSAAKNAQSNMFYGATEFKNKYTCTDANNGPTNLSPRKSLLSASPRPRPPSLSRSKTTRGPPPTFSSSSSSFPPRRHLLLRLPVVVLASASTLRPRSTSRARSSSGSLARLERAATPSEEKKKKKKVVAVA